MQDDLEQQVRDLLDHLYDYEYLQESALAHMLDPGGALPARERMRLLRSTIIQSLENLNPGSGVSAYSPRIRCYNVLNLHYVDRLTVQQVASELALSERQVYRDLRQAEKDLAALFWGELQGSIPLPALAPDASRAELALRELNRLPGDGRSLDVRALLEGAMGAVRRLAERRGVDMPTGVVGSLGILQGERHTVRQVLVSALSYTVQHAQANTSLSIAGERTGDRVRVEVSFLPDSAGLQTPEVTARFIERLSGECVLELDGVDHAKLTLTLRDQRPYHVLVIDDNEGLIALFQRYLTGEQYRVTGARDGVDGIRRAEATGPDIIFLDVLMPGQDGWEILQHLRGTDRTRDIPVIVCSVLDDSELAFSLGASGILPKPVSRQSLLEALAQWRPSLLPD